MKKPVLASMILFLVPAICAAQTTVRALGGNVLVTGEIWTLIEVKSDQAIKTVQGSYVFDPLRLKYMGFEVGTSVGSASLTEVETGPANEGRIGFRVTLPTPTPICCISNYHHILAVRLQGLAYGVPSGLIFDDSVFNLQVRNTSDQVLQTTWENGGVAMVQPAEASAVVCEDALIGLGDTRAVPISFNAHGTEIVISLSVLTDPERLILQEVSLGAHASGASLIVNNQSGSQRVGIVVVLNANQTFAPGMQHFVTLRFLALPNARPGPAPLFFSDDPFARELVTAEGQPLPLTFPINSLSIVTGREGDVSPRFAGNDLLSLADWVQLGRFAVGIEAIEGHHEFQRADCAPFASRGDGRITLADYVQAGRYAVDLDPGQPSGGPDRTVGSFSASDPSVLRSAIQSHGRLPERTRSVILTPIPSRRGDSTFAVELRGEGDENAVSFSIAYPETMQLLSANAEHGNLVLKEVPGRLGIMLAMGPGHALGSRLVTLRFRGRGEARFAEGPVAAEMVTVEAEEVGVVFGTALRKGR